MTVAEIISQRLVNQWLSHSPAQSPEQVVRQMLAVQAQDYLGSLWGIGQRVPGSTEQLIEASLANGSIIRTWPMRGTLHFVAAEDARWLVAFLAPRVIPKTRSIFKKAGLDESTLKKSVRVVIKALEKESVLTRDEMYAHLERAGISTANTRGLHITGHLAMKGHICFGPRKGKQQTLVLMDQWLRPAKPIEPDECLPTLAIRYFRGHGPATVQDFAWWTGITLTEARQAIALAGSSLNAEKLNEFIYYSTGEQEITVQLLSKASSRLRLSACLLPAFDEFTVAYKDRQLMLSSKQRHRNSMEILSPVIAINGSVVGTWSRSLSRKGIEVQLKPFANLPDSQRTKIKRQVKEYARFLSVDANASIVRW